MNSKGGRKGRTKAAKKKRPLDTPKAPRLATAGRVRGHANDWGPPPWPPVLPGHQGLRTPPCLSPRVHAPPPTLLPTCSQLRVPAPARPPCHSGFVPAPSSVPDDRCLSRALTHVPVSHTLPRIAQQAVAGGRDWTVDPSWCPQLPDTGRTLTESPAGTSATHPALSPCRRPWMTSSRL